MYDTDPGMWSSVLLRKLRSNSGECAAYPADDQECISVNELELRITCLKEAKSTLPSQRRKAFLASSQAHLLDPAAKFMRNQWRLPATSDALQSAAAVHAVPMPYSPANMIPASAAHPERLPSLNGKQLLADQQSSNKGLKSKGTRLKRQKQQLEEKIQGIEASARKHELQNRELQSTLVSVVKDACACKLQQFSMYKKNQERTWFGPCSGSTSDASCHECISGTGAIQDRQSPHDCHLPAQLHLLDCRSGCPCRVHMFPDPSAKGLVQKLMSFTMRLLLQCSMQLRQDSGGLEAFKQSPFGFML